MSWRYTLVVAFLGLSAALVAAVFQDSPGYMDADYYFQSGLRLAGGYGFSEMVLWNYLSEPGGLPYPSHAYWMPLTSILAALGMALTGVMQFATARLASILLAGLIPCLCAALALSLTGRADHARVAGLLAVFSGFYLPYLATTDSFGLYMLLGGAFVYLVGALRPSSSAYLSPSPAILSAAQPSLTRPLPPSPGRLSGAQPAPIPPLSYPSGELSAAQPALTRPLPPSPGVLSAAQRSRRTRLVAWSPLLLGSLAGLMHLTRADGLLWLGVALLFAAALAARESRADARLRRGVTGISLGLLGYLLVMGPWLARNLLAFGAPFAPGGGRALWITQYDELFIYPASILTPARWLSTGLVEILKARLWAAGLNLQTALAVQGQIFLGPLIILGLWRLRRDARVVIAGAAWLLTFLVMTLVFPYQGARGGFFHSGAALQLLFWAVAPLGLEALVAWVGRWRLWDVPRAQRFFSFGLVGLALLLTSLVVPSRLFGSGRGQLAWNESYEKYLQVEQALLDLGASPAEIVLVNNPPGYFIASRRPAIAIPFGDVDTLLEVAARYQAHYLLLEFNQLQGPDDLYGRPGDRPGLTYLTTVAGVRIYQVTHP